MGERAPYQSLREREIYIDIYIFFLFQNVYEYENVYVDVCIYIYICKYIYMYLETMAVTHELAMKHMQDMGYHEMLMGHNRDA